MGNETSTSDKYSDQEQWIMATQQQIEKAASSKTLRKCVHELKAILQNRTFPKSNSPRRKEYHDELQGILENIAATWYKVGVRRGHKMSGKAAPRRLQFSRTLNSRIFSKGIKVKVSSTR
jgi:hypothetical protein